MQYIAAHSSNSVNFCQLNFHQFLLTGGHLSLDNKLWNIVYKPNFVNHLDCNQFKQVALNAQSFARKSLANISAKSVSDYLFEGRKPAQKFSLVTLILYKWQR